MKTPLKIKLRALLEDRWPSYVLIRVAALMMFISSFLLNFSIKGKPEFAMAYKLRIGLAVLSGTIFIFTLIRKNHWARWYNTVFHSVMVLSACVTGWFNHVGMTESKEIWRPYPSFHIMFLILALMVPASYFLNFLLIMVGVIEILLIWFVLDIPHRPNLVYTGEPFGVLTLAMVSVLILFVRYRDEIAIKNLIAEKTANEFTAKLARVFLSFRDQANTPIQTLILFSETLKKNKPISEKSLEAMVRAVQTLKDSNTRLYKLESAVDWGLHNLMTDEEIENWLSELESEMKKFQKKK